MSTNPKLGEFEEIILLPAGIVYGNAYGVSLKDEIEHRLDREFSVGALQVTLHWLEKKEFLRSAHGDSSASLEGRHKLFFTLTVDGKSDLEYSRQTRNAHWDAIPPIILDLKYFL